MKIVIEAPDSPVNAALYLEMVAAQIRDGIREGYVTFHQNWKATEGCEHLSAVADVRAEDRREGEAPHQRSMGDAEI